MTENLEMENFRKLYKEPCSENQTPCVECGCHGSHLSPWKTTGHEAKRPLGTEVFRTGRVGGWLDRWGGSPGEKKRDQGCQWLMKKKSKKTWLY